MGIVNLEIRRMRQFFQIQVSAFEIVHSLEEQMKLPFSHTQIFVLEKQILNELKKDIPDMILIIDILNALEILLNKSEI